MKVRALLLAAAVAASACARKRDLKPAPDVGLPALLQAPIASLPSLSALRGKTVVIDFWATWCPPCRETIPHLNKLAAKFAGRPVVFLSVTDEDPEVVKKFLITHAMSPWIGLDLDRRMFAAFGVRDIPTTFIIDPYGRVQLKISPSWLYASDIEEAIAAKPPVPAQANGDH